MLNVIGIDIGYKNLGLVDVSVTDTFEYIVNDTRRIDLTYIKCPSSCTLPHTNEVADLVAHFIQDNQQILDKADIILLERQPPGGLTSIETVLLYVFRHKTKLVSPNSMHKHFRIGHLDYEHRKIKTEEITTPYLSAFDGFSNQVRKHDMADAMCLILFYFSKDKETYLRKCRRKIDDGLFEQFRCK